MKLTRAERKQAFAGTLKVLRRETKPDQETGAIAVLSQSRGGKQVLFPGDSYEARDARAKLLAEGKPITVDVPRKPNLWIIIKGWRLKQGSTEWETAVAVHDIREPTRLLAAAPSPPSEGGLKTRWGKTVDHRGKPHPKKVPPKGAQVAHLTSETERGYGGGGRTAVDEAAGVDDGTLGRYAELAAEENELKRNMKRMDGKKLKLEMRLAETRKRNMTGATAKIEVHLKSVNADIASAA